MKPQERKEKGRALAHPAPLHSIGVRPERQRHYHALRRVAQLFRQQPLHPEGTAPERRAQLLQLLKAHQGHDAYCQRLRVLKALQTGSLTTHEARAFLDVLSPASRVLELREDGHHIETIWVRQITGAGKVHRIGRYLLKAWK